MTAEKQETQEISLLDQFKQQHAQYVAQKDFTHNNLNQLIGAIHACEIMIKKYEVEEEKKGLSQPNLGDQGNGEAGCKEKECAA